MLWNNLSEVDLEGSAWTPHNFVSVGFHNNNLYEVKDAGGGWGVGTLFALSVSDTKFIL